MSETRGTWNYRVIRRAYGGPLGQQGETFLAIHEAHYEADKERPISVTVNPAYPTGDTPEELAEALEMMRAALEKPVLEYGDF